MVYKSWNNILDRSFKFNKDGKTPQWIESAYIYLCINKSNSDNAGLPENYTTLS